MILYSDFSLLSSMVYTRTVLLNQYFYNYMWQIIWTYNNTYTFEIIEIIILNAIILLSIHIIPARIFYLSFLWAQNCFPSLVCSIICTWAISGKLRKYVCRCTIIRTQGLLWSANAVLIIFCTCYCYLIYSYVYISFTAVSHLQIFRSRFTY